MAAIEHQHARAIRYERAEAALRSSGIAEREIDCGVACIRRHLLIFQLFSWSGLREGAIIRETKRVLRGRES